MHSLRPPHRTCRALGAACRPIERQAWHWHCRPTSLPPLQPASMGNMPAPPSAVNMPAPPKPQAACPVPPRAPQPSGSFLRACSKRRPNRWFANSFGRQQSRDSADVPNATRWLLRPRQHFRRRSEVHRHRRHQPNPLHAARRQLRSAIRPREKRAPAAAPQCRWRRNASTSSRATSSA